MKNTNKIFIALGIGAAAGAVLGVLFAPRKGVETRKLIAEKGNKLNHDIRNGINEGQKKLNTLKEGFKESVNSINRKVEEVM